MLGVLVGQAQPNGGDTERHPPDLWSALPTAHDRLVPGGEGSLPNQEPPPRRETQSQLWRARACVLGHGVGGEAILSGNREQITMHGSTDKEIMSTVTWGSAMTTACIHIEVPS